jgi:hypothetical protein
MGSVPPVDSTTMFDQITPVEICTDATFEIGMLSSLLPNSRDLTRMTRCGLTTSLVGKKKFPRVKREAVKVSEGEESIGLREAALMGNYLRAARRADFFSPARQRQVGSDREIKPLQGRHYRAYTHSKAPFFQTQMYPTIKMARKMTISSRPNTPNALNFTAHGNRKIVSTSKTTNRMAMM